jgi:hypothetical protein
MVANNPPISIKDLLHPERHGDDVVKDKGKGPPQDVL